MNKQLAGKIALVTGGSTGIGLAATQVLAAQGARVFITGRRQVELDAAVEAIGPAATGIRADASVLADLDAVYARIAASAARSAMDTSVVSPQPKWAFRQWDTARTPSACP